MKKRKIRQIMKDHLSISKDDKFNPDSVSTPDWLEKNLTKDKTNKKYSSPRWAISVASIIATFIFMLTPPGQAVSDFVYNIDIRWNEEHSKLEIKYDNNVEYDAYPELSKDLQSSNEFNSIDDLLLSYPNLQILKSKKYKMKLASVIGNHESISITSQYSVNNENIYIVQTIYYSDHTRGMTFSLTENATPLEATFNFGSILASGGFENGYAHLVAFDNNCEYSFICDNLTQELIIDFIESCYLK